MLRLENITKDYKVADTTVAALRGIDLAFRKNEFGSVLGPSGCGKTTLLNIIGGLDKYTSGEMFINGKSTRHFNDADWDVYRNHRIGFVFQSYNLIPHQTVLGARDVPSARWTGWVWKVSTTKSQISFRADNANA